MGNLLDLIILDTRNYDRSITSLGESFSSFFPHRIVQALNITHTIF